MFILKLHTVHPPICHIFQKSVDKSGYAKSEDALYEFRKIH